MPDNFPAGQIEHPAQGIVVGEAGLVFRDLAELTVQALNDIRRVYDFPNLGGICEKGAQNIPVVLPAFDAGGVLLAPLFFECHQVFQSLILGDSGIDLAIYHVLKSGVPFRDLGADYYNNFNREHKIRGYLKRLQALGWTLDTPVVSA